MITENDIQKLYYSLRGNKAQNWDRVLPFGELVADRWEKARFMNWGEDSSIYDSAVVFGDVRVGANTWIGPGVMLDGSGGALSIGESCDISAGVQIYTHDTVMRCLSGGKQGIKTGSVTIGSRCYIAPMCILTRGVTIGDCCVVAAHSFVNKSFESFSVVGGIPAKRIGRVRMDGEDIYLDYDGGS